MIPKTQARMKVELACVRRDLYHYIRRLGGRKPSIKDMANIDEMKAKIAELRALQTGDSQDE